jgi:penicillin-binding protein 1A
MMSALSIDRQRGPDLPIAPVQPRPEPQHRIESPLPPEWSDATKQLRDIRKELEDLLNDR